MPLFNSLRVRKRVSFSTSSRDDESMDSSCSSTCSRLSKEDIEEIINSPYDTGYTYTESAAYLRDGPAEFRHPQLCRRIRAYMDAPFDPLIAGRQPGDGWLRRTTRYAVNIVLSLLRTLLIVLAAPFIYAARAFRWLVVAGSSLAYGATSAGATVAVGAAHGAGTSAHFAARAGQRVALLAREMFVYAVAAVLFVVVTVLGAVYASLVQIGTGVMFIMKTALQAVHASLVGVGTGISWLVRGEFLRAAAERAAERSFVFASPIFTSTPVNQPAGGAGDLLRRKRAPRMAFLADNFALVEDFPRGGVKGEYWRNAGRFLGQLLRFVFWALAAIAIVLLLYVVASLTRDKILEVSTARLSSASGVVVVDDNAITATVSGGDTSLAAFQAQLDAIRAELRNVVDRMNAVCLVASSD